MEAVVLKSFTYKGLGGNKAGVVILENEMPEAKMQSIATELGFSETAFVKKVDEKNYEVRFFTPVCEVDLCGHATIAAFYYVGENLIENKSGNFKLYQNTKAGKLEIIINFNDNKVENVLMEQASPVFYGCVDEKEKSSYC